MAQSPAVLRATKGRAHLAGSPPCLLERLVIEQKTTHWRMPFLGNIWNIYREIHRDRKQTGGCQGQGVGRESGTACSLGLGSHLG